MASDAKSMPTDVLVITYHSVSKIPSIARPFNNYGPRQNEGSYAGVIPITIKKILLQKAPIVHGDGLQTRDYIYVKDTVDGFIKIYNNKNTRGRIINLATGEEITILKMIQTIANEMDYKGKFNFQKRRTADVRRHRGDINLARQLIDFKPKTSFEEGIKKTVEWYVKAIK